jgi:hypothetical protein
MLPAPATCEWVRNENSNNAAQQKTAAQRLNTVGSFIRLDFTESSRIVVGC